MPTDETLAIISIKVFKSLQIDNLDNIDDLWLKLSENLESIHQIKNKYFFNSISEQALKLFGKTL